MTPFVLSSQWDFNMQGKQPNYARTCGFPSGIIRLIYSLFLYNLQLFKYILQFYDLIAPALCRGAACLTLLVGFPSGIIR